MGWEFHTSMKYPFTTQMLGQVILNEPISQYLYSSFILERKQLYEKELKGKCRNEQAMRDVMNLLGKSSINNIEVRREIVLKILNLIRLISNDMQLGNINKLDAKYPIDTDIYLDDGEEEVDASNYDDMGGADW